MLFEEIFLSYESRLILPAIVSSLELGLRNFSNLDIAPLCIDKSLPWRTWVVDFQLGPSSCLATSFHAVVFPTPVGPEINKWGDSNEVLYELRFSCISTGIARLSKVTGDSVSSQLATKVP